MAEKKRVEYVASMLRQFRGVLVQAGQKIDRARVRCSDEELAEWERRGLVLSADKFSELAAADAAADAAKADAATAADAAKQKQTAK